MVDIESMMLGGILAALAGMIFVAIIVGVVVYIYSALALQTIGKKLKHKHPWLAWIPIASNAMVLQMGGFHWAWIFLLLIPYAGWLAIGILTIISFWRIFEKRKYAGAWSLLIIGTAIPFVGIFFGIAHLVILGLVAWQKN